MPHRSRHGGRHELGQNFLIHPPTIDRIVHLVATTDGPILEIGAGDGALTAPLAALGRDLVALELDEHRARRLRRRLPNVRILQVDALRHPLDRPVIVGNLPYHLTTPILRRLLSTGSWRHAVVLTQWEVARKRAGVGGSTMMTAQAAPWFTFALQGRVPARAFAPRPSVDGGLLSIDRRSSPLVDHHERAAYERFVRAVFTGRGRGIAEIAARAAGVKRTPLLASLRRAGIDPQALPRDLSPEQWSTAWRIVRNAP